jgi:xanthine dehydrogenase accessory factor
MDAVRRALIQALEKNTPAALATVVKTTGSSPRAVGAKMLVYADGSIVGSVGGGEVELQVIEAARAALGDGRTRYLDFSLANLERGEAMICGGEMDIFVEPLLTAPTLVIAGAGHVGAACAELGKFLGFRVVVLDDRPEFLSREKFPTADELHAGDLLELLRATEITPRSYVVLATRAHALDAELLGAVLETPAAYIGMLGSERRARMMMEQLKEKGVSAEALARVHAPIGLEIAAETPQEIAVSVMAQVIQVKSELSKTKSE